MEYVDGDRIDRYCDQRQLRVEERLALFRTVCSAVEYAHQRTVIHRDLKPSNIMITAQGVPKLIDFGIAKLTNSESGMVSVAVTETEQRLLTPEYASPEQARGDPITTSTDIYSLGVVLYELLTGRKPYRIASRPRGDLQRIIAEEQPPRPSTAVCEEETVRSQPEAAVESTVRAISRLRGEPPRRLRRTLRGDLDNIVLMALRKEPERRYASVGEFSADIGRYLEGLPVLARGDTWGYRAGKFARRHKVAVTAAGLVAISLIGGIVGSTSQAIRAARHAERADAINRFLVDDFIRASDANYYGNHGMTMYEAVQRAADRLKDSFQGHPATKASLHRIVGESLLNLGRYEEAVEQADLALRYFDAPNRSEFHEDLVSTLLIKGDALDSLDHFDEAEAVLRRAVERGRSQLGEEHPQTIHAMARLGETLQTISKYDQAEPLLRRAHELAMRFVEPGEPNRYTALNSLSELLRARERHAEAEPLREQLMELTTRHFGPEHPSALNAMNQLASLYFYQAKTAERNGDQEERVRRLNLAAPIFKRLVEAAPRVLPNDHDALAVYEGNYGVCLAKLKRHAEAEPHVLSAARLARAAFGADNDTAEWYLRNAVRFYDDWVDHEEVEEEKATLRKKWERYARRCVSLRVLRAKHDTEEDATPYWWCDHLVSRQTSADVDEYLEELWQQLLDNVPDDDRRANYLGNLGILLAKYGRHDRAEALLLDSYQRRKASLGVEHARTQWMLRELAGLLETAGKSEQAAKYRAELTDHSR